MEPKTGRKERFFSVELQSKRNLKNISLTNGSSDSVLVEGTLGEIVRATFAEGVILEVVARTAPFELTSEKTKSSNQQEMTSSR